MGNIFKKRDFFPRLMTGLVLVGLLLGAGILVPPWGISIAIGAIFFYILIYEWPQLNAWRLTIFYPTIPFVLLHLWNMSTHRVELLYLIAVTYAHDTGGYIFGNLFGKHPLAPSISPKKSWEGVAGGYLCSWLVGLALLPIIPEEGLCLGVWTSDWKMYTIFIALINAGAIAGDLFESYLKRRASLKDSGNILPGHGGVLDRLDSLLGSIVVWTLIYAFMFLSR